MRNLSIKKNIESQFDKPDVDSLAVSKNIINAWAEKNKGKNVDTNKPGKGFHQGTDEFKAMAYLKPKLDLYKSALDAAFMEKLKNDPSAVSLTEKEMNEATGGKAKEAYDIIKTWGNYRNSTKLKEAPLDVKTYGPASFGGPSTAIEVISYSPDKGMSTIKPALKTPQEINAKKKK